MCCYLLLGMDVSFWTKACNRTYSQSVDNAILSNTISSSFTVRFQFPFLLDLRPHPLFLSPESHRTFFAHRVHVRRLQALSRPLFSVSSGLRGGCASSPETTSCWVMSGASLVGSAPWCSSVVYREWSRGLQIYLRSLFTTRLETPPNRQSGHSTAPSC